MTRKKGEMLQSFFEGLPVRSAIYGMEAGLAYYSRVPVAIECASGLTDRFIAKQSLSVRGMIGHEKKPTLEYLIHKRKVHLVFSPHLMRDLKINKSIPRHPIRFGPHTFFVLLWDPEIMRALRKRGAVFSDFTEVLDRYIGEMPSVSDRQIEYDYSRFKMFYFDHVNDEAREKKFLARLGIKKASE